MKNKIQQDYIFSTVKKFRSNFSGFFSKFPNKFYKIK